MLSKRLKTRVNVVSFFHLPQAHSQANHPLNATFWSDRLNWLSLADRDLSWTKHVRRNVELFEQLALQLEAASRQSTLSEIAQPRAHLSASVLRWCLTSSTPTLRDQATRALYYYARRWPNHHFDLLQESLPVNDPYVGERILAVTYGLAMARQNDLEDPALAAEMLPQLARHLFDSMFAPRAPYSTTHFLARDYAWRTIALVTLLHPDLFADEEAGRHVRHSRMAAFVSGEKVRTKGKGSTKVVIIP